MSDSPISSSLLTAYREADYIVHTEGHPFSLQVDHYSAPLNILHRQYGVTSSAVITACNPRSKQLDKKDNELALQNLEQDLRTAGYVLLCCIGQDPQHRWPDEPGFLVIGIDRDTAGQLGVKYRQNAILFCNNDAIPELILLG